MCAALLTGDCCWDYDLTCKTPRIDIITPSTADTAAAGVLLTITGTWFNDYVNATVSYVTVGSNICAYNPANPSHKWQTTAGNGIVAWTDPTSGYPLVATIVCSLPPGAGINQLVTVYTLGKLFAGVNSKTQWGAPTYGVKSSTCPSCVIIRLSYNGPSLANVQASTSTMLTAGGTLVTITGTGLGYNTTAALTVNITMYTGVVVSYSWAMNSGSSTGNSIVAWTQNTVSASALGSVVIVMPAGQGTQIPISVTVQGQTSITPVYVNYNPPYISSIAGNTAGQCNTTGGNIITIMVCA